ncbi:histidinol-phosphatase [[Eubacterium] hominis]|uniref:histidinol-phosphatase n=1 Tax=[Eubacterium] hominis TaxID=2764325 RepID=UPI003A4DABCC
MQKFNYHSHTKRCGHASGEDEAYVLSAIQNGYQRMGFSDHAPYRNGYAKGERMHKEELAEYIQSVKMLQQKYADQIEIRIGLEFEYFEDQLDEILEYKDQMDYLIIGQHGPKLYEEEFYTRNSDEDILLYASLIEKACRRGLPDMIAHPDLYMFSKEEWTVACEQAAVTITKAAVEANIPLEINLNGIRYGYQQIGKEKRITYPYRRFWEVASRYPVKVVYGLDAHHPDKYGDLDAFHTVDELLKGIPLHKLEDLKFQKKL